MKERSEKRARAIAAAGPFEPQARSRAILGVEGIAGAVALIAAFLLMTGVVLVRTMAH